MRDLAMVLRAKSSYRKRLQLSRIPSALKTGSLQARSEHRERCERMTPGEPAETRGEKGLSDRQDDYTHIPSSVKRV